MANTNKSPVFFVFSKHEIVLQKNDDAYSLPEGSNHPLGISIDQCYSIGQYHEQACYAAEMNVPETLDKNYVWVSFKIAINYLSAEWFGVAARAHQIIQWEKNHRFCGRCGHVTQNGFEKLERKCEHCHLSFFPKISPAVIVLVKRDNKILMARTAQFPPGVYALIAGFVEVGETLEEAVHREVYEEAGIKIKNIVYAGSQPWPFPDSLMLAFTAEYESGEIELLDGELEHADWYDADHLPGLPSSPFSIAMKMINHFLSQSRAAH